MKNIMDIKQDFRVYCSTNFKELNKSLIEDTFKEENELILEGIASTTSIDEEGDYMTKECLEDMKRQAIGLNVLKEHGRKLEDVIGKVISIPESDSDKFKIKFKVLPSWEWYLMEFLDNEINLGLSIGAKAVDYEPNEDSNSYGWKVNKAKLYEISLVPLPANWDSFGSVKISKELTNDEIVVGKCFNGACKQIVKEYSENFSKELEDGKDDDEEFLTKKEALAYINEASLEIYERVLSEVLDETKSMIEKYHLNENTNNDLNESDKSNDKNIDENSSKKKEDEEKEKSMSEEIENKVEIEETPDVQKELEESNGTSNGEETEIMKEVKNEEIVDETVDVSVSVDEVSNSDVLKSIEEMKTSILKGIEDVVEAKVNAKFEEMSKEEEVRKSIRKEMEEELFKELTTERKPVETEQPKEVEKELNEEEKEEVKKAMSTHDIAKMLCS